MPKLIISFFNTATKKFNKFWLYLLLSSVLLLLAVLILTSSRYKASPEQVEPSPVVGVTNSSTDTTFNIKIPKIDVEAPILVGIDPTNKEAYDSSLNNGVALMQGSSLPGMKGNIFIYGHSSSTVSSPYEKIFASLNDLGSKDEINIYYKGRDLIYAVVEKKIIDKDDFSVLQPTTEETLTLMTCWPIGTSKQRLVVVSLRKKE